MYNQQIALFDNAESNPSKDNSDLQRYLNEIGRYKVLSNEESMRLAKRFIKFNDQEAAHQLIIANLRIVVKIAHKYQAYWRTNFMDLVQEGNAGLVKAIEKFDPNRKVTFYTYATYWVRSFILNFLMNNSRLVKISTTETMRRMYFNYSKKKQQLQTQTGQVDDDSLAKILQINKEKLTDVNERMSSSEISLATLMSHDSDCYLQDIIKHPGPSVPEEVESRELQSKIQHVLEKERNRLTSREHLILDERLLSDSPITLSDSGNRLNISRERARQLEVKLKNKLRKIFLKAFVEDPRMLCTG